MKRLLSGRLKSARNNRFSLFWAVFSCCVALGMLTGNASGQPPASQDPEPERFHRILLLPAFDICRIYGENVSLMGPLSGKVFVTAQVAPDATDLIYSMVKRSLARMQPLELVPAARNADGVMVGVEPIAGNRSERIAAVQALGRQSGAEGVFIAYIYGFRERVGTAYGAENPARVSFELNLVSVASGRIVWQAHFSETQQTLNENVFQLGKFLKRKGRWVTAEQMAEGAVDDLMGAFENQFFKSPP